MANKKAINTNKTSELGLKGKGVEILVIPEIEVAANKFVKAHNETVACADIEEELKNKLIEVVRKNKDKLVADDNGGVSYRYGEKLVVLAPTKETIKVKSIHDG